MAKHFNAFTIVDHKQHSLTYLSNFLHLWSHTQAIDDLLLGIQTAREMHMQDFICAPYYRQYVTVV